MWEDSLKEFRTYGGLTSGMDFSRILAPPGGETIRQIRKSVGDARMVRTFSIMAELGLHMLTEAKKFDVFCLFFNLFLQVLNDRVYERHFAIKALECGNDLYTAG